MQILQVSHKVCSKSNYISTVFKRSSIRSVEVRQRDSKDCGAACLASIGNYFGVKLPVARLRQLAGTDSRGTNVLGLTEAASHMGLTAKAVRAGMDALPKVPLPIIVHLIQKPSKHHHYAVIYRIKKDQIWMMDPAKGSVEKMPIQKFMDLWTGVFVLFEKKKGFKAFSALRPIHIRFWELIKPHKLLLLLAFFLALVYTLLGLAISVYVQKITDLVLVNKDLELLHGLSLIMIIIITIQTAFDALKNLCVLHTGKLIDTRLVMGYYRHLLALPQRFFDTIQVGEIISRVNDAVKIRAFINNMVIEMLANFLIVASATAIMFMYSWQLASCVVLIIPMYLLVYLLVNRYNKKVERRMMEKTAHLESCLVESISQMRTVKLLGIESYMNRKVGNRFTSLLADFIKSGKNDVFAKSSTLFLSAFLAVTLLWTGSVLVIKGTITTGELFSCYALLVYFNGPVRSLVSMNKSIKNAWIAAERLFEILDLNLEGSENEIEIKSDQLGDISFQNISFRYGPRVMVFDEFSAAINKNEITAIVGESGSGKTTLVSLLLQLYPLIKGKIVLGDIDLNQCSKKSIRRLISVIPQHIELFSGSIANNIAIGEREPNIGRIQNIASKLGISSFVESLPQGYFTDIGENGTALSGGQKQLIALARALYTKPEILILDEGTSALDPYTEERVKNSIIEYAATGKTVIIVTHRLRSITHANRILCLKQGCLVEQGTHNTLIRNRGTYFELWKRQQHL